MSDTRHVMGSVVLAAIVGLGISALLPAGRQARAADAGSVAGASSEMTNAQFTYKDAMARLVQVRQDAMKVAATDPEYRAAQQLVETTHAAYMASRKASADVAQAK